MLEGNYLRCGLVTDILLLDDAPSKYSSYSIRESRWIRGDWQIVGWLNKKIKIKNGTYKANPLNILSKFKILDNLIRSIIPISVMLVLTLLVVLKLYLNTKILGASYISLALYSFSALLDIFNYIVFKEGKDSRFIYAHKSLNKNITQLEASILRGILEIIYLPYKSYVALNSIIKSIYRMKISKMNLLEWTTAEEAEKLAKTDMISYYKLMYINVIFGVLFLVFGLFIKQILYIILGLLWIIGPYIACNISKDKKEILPVQKLINRDKEYILEIGEKTWNYFKDYINEENNFLPPDNYQEGRKNKIAPRTSSTNIGLRPFICYFCI